MARAAQVSENVVSVLISESDLRSGDVADQDHHRTGNWDSACVFNGSRDGERSGRLGRGWLTSEGGD